ncbi:MAG: hypothetical protein WC819_05550 [Parcubacteria group bacterium]
MSMPVQHQPSLPSLQQVDQSAAEPMSLSVVVISIIPEHFPIQVLSQMFGMSVLLGVIRLETVLDQPLMLV